MWREEKNLTQRTQIGSMTPLGKSRQGKKHFTRNWTVPESWWDSATGIGFDVQEWNLPFVKQRQNV